MSSHATPRPAGGGPSEDLFLRARGLSKSYGPVPALLDVDLDVHLGEVVALVGENGSGKSTLSRLLAGVLPPDAGTLEVQGRHVSFASLRDALHAGVAMVSQEPTSVPHLSVAENVLLPRLQRLSQRVRRGELPEQARPFLEQVGLDVDPSVPLGALAAGSRELVEVAKALVARPRLLVLDEATTRLPDPEHLFGVVESLAADGMGVVFITHRLREIRRLASRAVVLRDGHRVADLPRDELSDEHISRAMVGRELRDYYSKRDTVPGDPALEVDALVTDRGPVPLTLTVRAGEVVGLAGLVGAGRSELLETVAGVRRTRGGSVRVAGRPLRPGSPRAAIAAGTTLVPEDRFRQALVRPHTVRQNLALPFHRLRRRTDTGVERRRADGAIDAFGIRCAGQDAPVASLSGGNAQKVVFARSLDTRPTVLLLDEPTRGVDVGARAEIYDLIGDAVTAGTAVLLASSDLTELLGLCDRVAVLHDGELVDVLERQELTEETVALLCAGGTREAAAA